MAPDLKDRISPLFMAPFQVDEQVPFKRYLNRLEVEIGREDYAGVLQVEPADPCPGDAFFAGCTELTERLLRTSQNSYNCRLLEALGIRVYCDYQRYQVYYRWQDGCLRFLPGWRNRLLRRFFAEVPLSDSGWQPADAVLADASCRYLPDHAGGALLIELPAAASNLPLLTVSHGPYDPHTLEVALYLLRSGKGRAALVNLGFAGREPLTDDNLEQLKSWGVPLNPSNIDVIYPYVDHWGRANCFKHEESLCRYVGLLARPEPEIIIDIHGYVGTHAADQRVLVGMGGQPPYPTLAELGSADWSEQECRLQPSRLFERGLKLVQELSREVFVQFCMETNRCAHFALNENMTLQGRLFDPGVELTSLIEGEERSVLPSENVRWLPSAWANARQRAQACQLGSRALCLHVEIPTRVRRRIARIAEQLGTDTQGK